MPLSSFVEGKRNLWALGQLPFFSVHGKDNVRHVDSIVVFNKAFHRHHAIALRRLLGREIAVSDNGDHSLPAQNMKGIVPTGRCGFGRIALMPIPAFKKITRL